MVACGIVGGKQLAWEIHTAWVLADSKAIVCTAPLLWQVMIQFLFIFQSGEMSKWHMGLWTGTLILGRISLITTSYHCILSNISFLWWRVTLEFSAQLLSTFYWNSKWPKTSTFHLWFPKSIQEYSPQACTFSYRRAELFWVIGPGILTSLYLGAVDF